MSVQLPTAPPELRIDRRSGVPLHVQIDSLLRQLIEAPQYAEGGLLPDEISLARQLGVSRNTIRAGMSKLIYEGVVERKQGHGTRVSRRPFHTSLSEWHSLTREMQVQGIAVENFELRAELVPAPEEVSSALQLKPGRGLWKLTRIRGWSGMKVVLTISWMHPRLGFKGDEEFGRPLYEVIEQSSGIVPVRSIEDITACCADNYTARCLEVEEGSPLLLRKRTTLDASDGPVEYNLNWYRSDIHSLQLDLRRS